jgi:hypothetical protein
VYAGESVKVVRCPNPEMAGVNCNIECPKGIGVLKKILFTNSFGYFAISQANSAK